MPQAATMDRSPHNPPYKRHRPEQTLLYQIVEQHYPEFRDVMAAQCKPLPMHVQKEFPEHLKCGRLNLNVHFHMLFLDGVYTENNYGKTRFQPTGIDGPGAYDQPSVGRLSGAPGILERDEENSYLSLEGDEDPMQQVLGCSISYRIAIGPQQGRKVFTLQTLPSREEDDRFAQVAKES